MHMYSLQHDAILTTDPFRRQFYVCLLSSWSVALCETPLRCAELNKGDGIATARNREWGAQSPAIAGDAWIIGRRDGLTGSRWIRGKSGVEWIGNYGDDLRLGTCCAGDGGEIRENGDCETLEGCEMHIYITQENEDDEDVLGTSLTRGRSIRQQRSCFCRFNDSRAGDEDAKALFKANIVISFNLEESFDTCSARETHLLSLVASSQADFWKTHFWLGISEHCFFELCRLSTNEPRSYDM